MDESHEIDIKIGLPEITIDPEKNIRVVDGVPTQKDEFGTLNPAGTEAIIIPNTPHVFTVNHLKVCDTEHNPPVDLDNVKVLIAHGHRVGNSWQFLNGQDVANTVRAYNQYASDHKLTPVEFLAVCNSNPQPESVLGNQIKVGEIGWNPNIPVAHSLGQNVGVAQGGHSRVDQDGKVYLDLSLGRGKFFDLNTLINKKSAESKIKFL